MALGPLAVPLWGVFFYTRAPRMVRHGDKPQGLWLDEPHTDGTERCWR